MLLAERAKFCHDCPMDMLTFVVSELQARKGQWPAICKATGIDYSWMSKLAREDIPEPGVKKVQRLADYFRQTDRAA